MLVCASLRLPYYALVVFLGGVFVSITLWRLGVVMSWNEMRCWAKWMFGLLIVQILLGVFNIILSLPLVLAVAHNIGAALLLLCSVLCHQRLKAYRIAFWNNVII